MDALLVKQVDGLSTGISFFLKLDNKWLSYGRKCYAQNLQRAGCNSLITHSNAHNPQSLLPFGVLLLQTHVLAQPTGLRCLLTWLLHMFVCMSMEVCAILGPP